MTTIQITVIRDVLTRAEGFPAGTRLYLSFAEPWTLDSTCVVSDEGDAEPGPAIAVQNGMEYIFGMDVAQDVAANARAQNPEVTGGELFRAFIHYYDNDAFIAFEDSEMK